MKSRLNAFIEKNKHAFLLLYFCIYFPWFHHLERTVTTHFHVIHTALDDMIPFCEYFIVPYLLWFGYVAWAVGYFYLKNKDEYFKQLGVTDVTNLREYSTVELGNNFQLGTKYSDSMGLFYMDENNEKKPYYMGCYGIGLGRIIACLIENNVIKENDKIKGFALPYDIAPYKVQIIYNENNKEEGEKLYNYLLQNNINAIIDDRENLNIGNRINDFKK